MSKLNILLLASGRFELSRSEGEYPYYLCESDGVPLIQTLIEKCTKLNPSKITCMFTSQDVAKYHLRNMIQQMHPAATVHPVQNETKGAACTALLAAEQIDNDDELIILSANEILDISFEEVVQKFRNDDSDAGVVIFKSLHPRYSFVRLTKEGLVVEAAEKNPISPHAVAGMYWFNSGSLFMEAVKDMIRKDANTNNIFYISPALNELVLLHKKIGTFRIEPNLYRPLKNPNQIQAFEAGFNR